MNQLPRFVAILLFVVLAALVSLLAIPVWRSLQAPEPAAETAGTDVAGRRTPPASPPPSRAYQLLQRAALLLAAAALALTVTLIFSQPPASRLADSRTPFRTTRTEVGALARLAESSVAQSAELSRERDVRRRAEEDARFKQQLLTQSLDEKIRLGHDLHDGIIQSLYAAGLTLESVRALIKSPMRRIAGSRRRARASTRRFATCAPI